METDLAADDTTWDTSAPVPTVEAQATTIDDKTVGQKATVGEAKECDHIIPPTGQVGPFFPG